ncbi:lysophospholipid acyltransferase family protein [Falsihalocynthiibacter arcticus]|uniref:Lauroyl acyltransferase n=1 Tax=Falsihalocynthiibacter arcticus TaxID=1579316 RepID=A0A126V742_9RHOB|nr:lysophospholipid acyltransferase family protein [Falsihalocynthiibacter arcticus]AML53529.1 lauroyl acyltransferase [Falsihalocynthiibacter arcticus]
MSQENLHETTAAPKPDGPFRDRLLFWFIRIILAVLHLVPYPLRIRIGGWFFKHIVAPVAGYRRRIRVNLDLVLPNIDPVEKERLTRAVPENFGRTMIELFSPGEFLEIARKTTLNGPGLEALEKARVSKQSAILVSGHFGNYDVVRAKMIDQGFDVGGLYRPMKNAFFNDYYVSTISKIGQPLFQRGRRGMAQMVKFLRSGGTLAILIDQHMGQGAPLTFFGQPAQTALSAAQLALKYNAVLIPCYAIRQEDGLNFRIELEEPVPIGSAEEMTQALNDSLEKRVRENMDQWLWIHRRWKAAGSPE